MTIPYVLYHGGIIYARKDRGKMGRLNIQKACDKGGQLLSDNQHYDVGMDDLNAIFRNDDYGKAIMLLFRLGVYQGYKIGQKQARVNKSKKVSTTAEFYRDGIRELSAMIQNNDYLESIYHFVRSIWEKDRKEQQNKVNE